MDNKLSFLVGCPRSGTTLLQSMIASHSRVVSYPETHFFSKTLPINPFLRRLKLYGPGSREIVTQYLKLNGYLQLNPFENTPGYQFFTHSTWCLKLIEILDKMTTEGAHKQDIVNPVWGLEKTPRHLHYISSIEQTNSSIKFLHLLRQGKDVVASLHLATKQYPEQWGGERSIKKCINWWNNSMRSSLKHQNKANHLFVVYEQLLESPERVLQTISNFLELEYQKTMGSDFHNTADSLTKEEEKWKDQNSQKSLKKSNKLEKHFEPSTINFITDEILDIDLRQFYH